MTLLDECIALLGSTCEVFNRDKSAELFNKFEQNLLFTKWGRIDWEVLKKDFIVTPLSTLDELDILYCYIFWDEYSLPVIKAEFDKVCKNLDDVLAVSFDTWILSLTGNIVIEFYHEGNRTIGYRRKDTPHW
jgi:hypothetical protein